jgi:hypothetical protein
MQASVEKYPSLTAASGSLYLARAVRAASRSGDVAAVEAVDVACACEGLDETASEIPTTSSRYGR